MNEAPPEVKAPPMTMAGSGDDDWRIHLYNQERMLVSQEQITDVLQRLLDQQREMAEMAAKLNMTLGDVSQTMEASTKATSGLVGQMIKVPIAMTVVGASSWAFMYAKAISEHTWLIIMGVAVFPWLGDSISAISKLIRGRDGDGK